METLEWRWRKSSYSGNGGGNCVEVGTLWRKSSYSGNGGADCVEVARNLPRTVAVRDSKDPHGPVLTVESAGWPAFPAAMKAGHPADSTVSTGPCGSLESRTATVRGRRSARPGQGPRSFVVKPCPGGCGRGACRSCDSGLSDAEEAEDGGAEQEQAHRGDADHAESGDGLEHRLVHGLAQHTAAAGEDQDVDEDDRGDDALQHLGADQQGDQVDVGHR